MSNLPCTSTAYSLLNIYIRFLKVQELKVDRVISEACGILIGSLPVLKTLTCKHADPSVDMPNGVNVVPPYAESLCDVLRDRAPCLEKVVLQGRRLDSSSTVDIIETCRAITTMREIM